MIRPGRLVNQQTHWSPAQQEAAYDTFEIHVEYRTEMGVLQVPVSPVDPNDLRRDSPSGFGGVRPAQITSVPSGPTASCALIRTSNPVGMKIVSFVASRAGKKPVLPSPYPTRPDSNLVLAEAIVIPLPPRLGADGMERIYQAAGRFSYYLKNPVYPGERTPSALSPADDTNWQEASFGPGDWDSRILFA